MPQRLWVTVLAAALGVHLALSGASQVLALQQSDSGAGSTSWVLAGLALVALAAAAGAALVVARQWRLAHERRRVQDQSQAAAESLSSEWLWETDLDGRLTYSSEGVRTLLGYAPPGVVGRADLDLLYDEKSQGRSARMLAARRTSLSGWQDVELTWMHADGSPVRLVGSAVPVRDKAGTVTGFRGARRPAHAPAPHRDPELRSRVERFVADPQLDVALQPLVRLGDQSIVGVEALARFSDGRSPDQWFREAQACGLSSDLDLIAFEHATGLFDALPPDVYLSVNAGPDLLLDSGFRTRLQHSGLPLDRLVVEITEHARVSDYEALAAAVDALREHRVRFAVDDTGAGFASLNHVLQLRPDIIKLDRGLLTGLESDPARRSLVTALVLLALELGATVTGEGVETPGQLEALATLGVDQCQGFLLARPSQDPEQWQAWWRQRTLQELLVR